LQKTLTSGRLSQNEELIEIATDLVRKVRKHIDRDDCSCCREALKDVCKKTKTVGQVHYTQTNHSTLRRNTPSADTIGVSQNEYRQSF
jgi:hypothetical protein